MSREIDTADAIEQVRSELATQLDGAPDFLAVFSSRHHTNRTSLIPPALAEAFPGATIAGCAAHSIIGAGEEEEDESALSVTAANLPGVDITTVVVDPSTNPTWEDSLPSEAKAVMVVVDAFSTDAEALLRRLDDRFADAPKFGGFASGGVYPGSNVLYANDGLARQGAVVTCFSGDVEVDTIVAQGCRPIGEPMTVTRHNTNMILELEQGRPADVLQKLYETLPAEDRALIPDSLHLGIRMHERADGTQRRGDFLVRPLVSVDPNSGAITIGGRVRDRDVVQFQLRDARASTEDLQAWLSEYQGNRDSVRGALLFSCVARGIDLFGEANHDTGQFIAAIGPVPVGGFFCAREIGPVRGETFIHGYTSTFVLFRPGD